MKKTPVTAKENALPASAREELRALVERNAPLAEIIALFERHGQRVPVSTASRVAARQRAVIERAAAAARVVEALAKRGNTKLSLRAASAIGDAVLASLDPDDPQSVKLLNDSRRALVAEFTAELRERELEKRAEAVRKELELAERRLKLLESKQAEAGKIVADQKLTPAERERKLKEIFGIA